MSFKTFFIQNEGSAKQAEPQKTVFTKTKTSETTFPTETTFPSETTFPNENETIFPSNDMKFPEANVVTSNIPDVNKFLDKIVEVYDNGFAKLNQPGYDFYEFFRSVSKAGIDNPQVYQMAIEMAQAMDSNVSKQSLLNQAEYYISELTKVHSGFRSDGQNKISDLTSKKNSETNTLSSDINSLEKQLKSIQSQIASKKQSLSEIDKKYLPNINEISAKLSANDIVKDRLISNINKVKSNISNNLK